MGLLSEENNTEVLKKVQKMGRNFRPRMITQVQDIEGGINVISKAHLPPLHVYHCKIYCH